MSDTDPLAPFRLLAKRQWNWGLSEFAAHLGVTEEAVKPAFLQFRAAVNALNALGEKTLARLLEA